MYHVRAHQLRISGPTKLRINSVPLQKEKRVAPSTCQGTSRPGFKFSAREGAEVALLPKLPLFKILFPHQSSTINHHRIIPVPLAVSSSSEPPPSVLFPLLYIQCGRTSGLWPQRGVRAGTWLPEEIFLPRDEAFWRAPSKYLRNYTYNLKACSDFVTRPVSLPAV